MTPRNIFDGLVNGKLSAIRMLMPVVQVWIVRMTVPEGFMSMPVRVRLGHLTFMNVLVVLVVPMNMLMLDRLMFMLVNMPFGEVNP